MKRLPITRTRSYNSSLIDYEAAVLVWKQNELSKIPLQFRICVSKTMSIRSGSLTHANIHANPINNEKTTWQTLTESLCTQNSSYAECFQFTFLPPSAKQLKEKRAIAAGITFPAVFLLWCVLLNTIRLVFFTSCRYRKGKKKIKAYY